MPRVLVTGGAGFIGSHVVAALIRERYRVTVVDDLSHGQRENVPFEAELIRQDIRRPELREIFRDTEPDYVIHLAAQKNLRLSLADPLADADVNINGSLRVFDLCRQWRVKKVVFTSSGGAVYSPANRLPIRETGRIEPLSPYGLAKRVVEQYAEHYSRLFGLPIVALRLANVYGPRQDPSGEAGVVAIFADRLRRRQPMIIYGDGRQTRDFIYVDDAVAAIIAALGRPISSPLNIATGKQTSINAIAALINRLVKRPVAIKHRPAVRGEIKRSALHIGRARKALGWRPTVDLNEGLHYTWQWVQSQAAGSSLS